MQESEHLGTLVPSSPDFLPIIRQSSEKYGLPEVGPEDERIAEMLLEEAPVSLEAFHEEIKERVQEVPGLPTDPEFRASWPQASIAHTGSMRNRDTLSALRFTGD